MGSATVNYQNNNCNWHLCNMGIGMNFGKQNQPHLWFLSIVFYMQSSGNCTPPLMLCAFPNFKGLHTWLIYFLPSKAHNESFMTCLKPI